MARHQRRSGPYDDQSFWWLLLLEVRDLVRAVGLKRVTAVVIVTAGCVLATEVALSSSTPGPALTAPWRWVVALAAAALVLAGWALRRAFRETDAEPDGAPTPPTQAPRHPPVAQR